MGLETGRTGGERGQAAGHQGQPSREGGPGPPMDQDISQPRPPEQVRAEGPVLRPSPHRPLGPEERDNQIRPHPRPQGGAEDDRGP